ncbi:uncharacterized protein SAPINGB_P000386 [Magnusiomyces paraingens]|uniref:UBC core domain-containing protein n=1 Tax=Magnusiomyces paraingens TaxID=2606893 RepID=A0A5E8AZG1_9ASCO|nr:uncharacterized protein SAPINGB_P000386 [Saprochaete ingens]VVT44348.1 unnamed protein product [Saprochaete ingens]
MDPSVAAIKRLTKELKANAKDPNPALEFLQPVSDNNLLLWKGRLKGVPNTPYQDGLWDISIKIPPSYPLHPPEIKFITPICHPNIHATSGEVCLDVLKAQWTPAWSVSSACTAIQAMLSDPEPDSPLNIDAANLARNRQIDPLAYDGLVRYYTRHYACSKN